MAAYMGINLRDFYSMTPREFQIWAKGFSNKRKDDFEALAQQIEADRQNSVISAFLTSRWVWQKTVNIDKFLNLKKKEQTPEDMLSVARSLTLTLGGEVEGEENG